MSEGINIDVTATPNFVGFYPSRREKVIHVLSRALEIRHRVSDSHERWQFTLPHVHLPCSPPRPTAGTPQTPEAKPKPHGMAKRPSGSTVDFSEPD